MPKSNWLEVTGQMWKLYVALLSCVTALIAFPFAVIAFIAGHLPVMPYLVTGTVLSVITVLWLMWSLCCPKCERSLVWKMISKCSHTTWLVELVALDTCPHCMHSLRNSNRNQIRGG